jgi:hypothetical protein
MWHLLVNNGIPFIVKVTLVALLLVFADRDMTAAGEALTGVFGGLVDEVEYVLYLIKLRLRFDDFVQQYITGSANHGQRHNGNRVREQEAPPVIANRGKPVTPMLSNHHNSNLGATPPRERARDKSQDPIPEAVIQKYGLPRRETRSQAAITKTIPYAFL